MSAWTGTHQINGHKIIMACAGWNRQEVQVFGNWKQYTRSKEEVTRWLRGDPLVGLSKTASQLLVASQYIQLWPPNICNSGLPIYTTQLDSFLASKYLNLSCHLPPYLNNALAVCNAMYRVTKQILKVWRMPLQPGSTFQGAFVISTSKHGPWTSENSFF